MPRIEVTPGSPEWKRLLQRIEKDDPSLTELDLNGNQLGPNGAEALVEALRTNKHIISLDLSGTDIQIGIKAIVSLPSSLTFLKLSRNNLWDYLKIEDIKAFASRLPPSLTTLELNHNFPSKYLGLEGLIALVSHLPNCLTSLKLNDNALGRMTRDHVKTLLPHLPVNLTEVVFIGRESCLNVQAFEPAYERIVANCKLRDQFHEAIKTNQIEEAHKLLGMGVSLLSKTGDKENTPLHWAAQYGHFEVAQFLIVKMSKRNITFNCKNKNGKTAFGLLQNDTIRQKWDLWKIVTRPSENLKNTLSEEKKAFENEKRQFREEQEQWRAEKAQYVQAKEEKHADLPVERNELPPVPKKQEKGAKQNQELIQTPEIIPAVIEEASTREAVIQEAIAAHFLAALEKIRQFWPEKKPRTFISCRSDIQSQGKLIEQLAKDLQAAGMDILLDKWDKQPGLPNADYHEEIARCEYTLLAGSRRLMEEYQKERPSLKLEINQVYGKLKRTPGYVIPLLLDGDVYTVLPSFLQDVVPIDFRDLTKYHRQVFSLLRVLLTRPFQQQIKTLERKQDTEQECSKDVQAQIDTLKKKVTHCENEIQIIEEDFEDDKTAMLKDEEWIREKVKERIDIGKQIVQILRPVNRINQDLKEKLEGLKKHNPDPCVNNNNNRGVKFSPTLNPQKNPELSYMQIQNKLITPARNRPQVLKNNNNNAIVSNVPKLDKKPEPVVSKRTSVGDKIKMFSSNQDMKPSPPPKPAQMKPGTIRKQNQRQQIPAPPNEPKAPSSGFG